MSKRTREKKAPSLSNSQSPTRCQLARGLPDPTVKLASWSSTPTLTANGASKKTESDLKFSYPVAIEG